MGECKNWSDADHQTTTPTLYHLKCCRSSSFALFLFFQKVPSTCLPWSHRSFLSKRRVDLSIFNQHKVDLELLGLIMIIAREWMQITNSASTQQPRAKEKEEKERIDVGQCQVVESIGNQGKEQEEMAFSPFPFFSASNHFFFSPTLSLRKGHRWASH